LGGKANSLVVLSKNKIIIPNGFVVNSNAYYDFFKKNNLIAIADSLKTAPSGNILKIAATLKKLIINGSFPEELAAEIKSCIKRCPAKSYAVRSSANVEDNSRQSWAGQFESYLNILSDDVIYSIKKCWSSVFSGKVINYIINKQNISSIKMAVIIQGSIKSDVSGICFTKNPLTGDDNILIEAIFGMGELLAQGQVTPDSYEVERKSNIILEANINEQSLICSLLSGGGVRTKKIKKTFKQKLTGQEIIDLAKMAVKIEKIYGDGCDIEWCKKKGVLYILQSRPITTGIRR
jgi:pyruvate,water dikinase